VLNNRSWEMLRVFDPKARFNDLSDWHFADMAPSLGGIGRRVRSRAELAAALEAAWNERGKFQIVEVMLDRGVTSDSLRRFVTGLNQRKRS
jgi:indolepyruvate decarboxylase